MDKISGQKKYYLKKKLLAFILGSLIAFLMLEGFLIVTGALFYQWREGTNKQQHNISDSQATENEKDIFKILCVGDSMSIHGFPSTYIPEYFGVKRRSSWPEFLENKLNIFLKTKGQKQRVKVVNKAVPGLFDTTGYFAEHMEEMIHEVQPDMLVMMTWMNEIRTLKFIKYGLEPGFLTKFVKYAKKLHTYKLFEHLWMALLKRRMRTNEHWLGRSFFYINRKVSAFRVQDWYEKTENQILEQLKVSNKWGVAESFKNLGDAMMRDNAYGEIKAEISLIKSYFKTLPSDSEIKSCFSENSVNTDENGDIELGKILFCFDNVSEQFQKSIVLDESDDKLLSDCLYNEASLNWRVHHTRLFQGPDIDHNELVKSYNCMMKGLFSHNQAVSINENIRSIKKVCDREKVQIALMQYPYISAESLKDIFRDEKNQTYKPPIFIENVNNLPVSESEKEKLFTDYFAVLFGHMSAEGYKLVADNAAEAIRKYIVSEILEDTE